MKKFNISYIIAGCALLWGTSACHEPEQPQPSEGLAMINSIVASFWGDERPENSFTGEIDFEKQEIAIVFPYNYPRASDTLLTDRESLKKVRLVADIENNVYITPALNTLDMTKDNYVDITDQYGVTRKFRIYADVRKSSECDITSFSFISEAGNDTIAAVVNASNKEVKVTSGDELGKGYAVASVSPHATITPNPSDTLDYANGVEFVVTAQNGVDYETWIVQRGFPAKRKKGLRPKSAVLLWTVKIANLGYNCPALRYGDGDPMPKQHQNGLAPCGDYVLVNEVGIDNPVYLNRNTGAIAGRVNFADIASYGNGTGNQCVTADEAGHILVCSSDDPELVGGTAPAFKIWTMNNLDATPVELISQPAAYNVRGHHMSVCGDITKDAIITVPINAESPMFHRWTIKGGVLKSQTPDLVTPTGFGIGSWKNCDVVYTEPKEDADYLVNAYCSSTAKDYKPGADGAINIFMNYVRNNAAFQCSPYFDPDGSTAGPNSNNWINAQVDYKKFNNLGYAAEIRVNTFTWGSDNFDTVILYELDGSNFSVPVNLSNTKKGLRVWEKYGAKNYGVPTGLGAGANGVELQLSEDGYYMYLYFMFAKGGVGCLRFDCFDVPED